MNQDEKQKLNDVENEIKERELRNRKYKRIGLIVGGATLIIALVISIVALV